MANIAHFLSHVFFFLKKPGSRTIWGEEKNKQKVIWGEEEALGG